MSLLPRRAAPGAPATGYSLLDSQLAVSGDLETAGSLRVDGRLMGSIVRADAVVIGVGASMKGDITAREVIVGGTVEGNVMASERVELQATAIVNGDVITQSVLVQEGGVINGRMVMRPPAERVAAGSAAAASTPAPLANSTSKGGR